MDPSIHQCRADASSHHRHTYFALHRHLSILPANAASARHSIHPSDEPRLSESSSTSLPPEWRHIHVRPIIVVQFPRASVRPRRESSWHIPRRWLWRFPAKCLYTHTHTDTRAHAPKTTSQNASDARRRTDGDCSRSVASLELRCGIARTLLLRLRADLCACVKMR